MASSAAGDMPSFDEVARVLRGRYGHPRHGNPRDPLSDLVFIMLSRMTQEVKYVRTYQALRNEFPKWALLRDARLQTVQRALRDAGLAQTKARQLKATLAEITQREGRLRLNRLRLLPDDVVEDYLASLPGVGRKSAKCVMLYV